MLWHPFLFSLSFSCVCAHSFCYVDDMVGGLISLMNGDQIGPINLGNPDEYTIKQLAELTQGYVDPNASVIYK